jgi:hypothetical protein
MKRIVQKEEYTIKCVETIRCGGLDYPQQNPTVDWIDVLYELPNEIKKGTLVINAVSGKIMKTININQNNGTVIINTNTWSPGIYFATLSIEGMQSNIYEIVIRK